jgi:hypothetical protein
MDPSSVCCPNLACADKGVFDGGKIHSRIDSHGTPHAAPRTAFRTRTRGPVSPSIRCPT